MVRRIAEILGQNGYELQKDPLQGVWLKETAASCNLFVIMKGEYSAGVLQEIESEILHKIQIMKGKTGTLLFLLVEPVGILSESQRKCLSETSNVWLISEDFGIVYVFENQPSDFDGMRSVLEDGLRLPAKKKRIPYVTIGLILCNLLVFGLEIVSSYSAGTVEETVLSAGEVRWDLVWNHQQIYRLFTAMFLHYSFEHLLSNMVTLGMMGMIVERYMKKVDYLLTYLLAGLAGNVLTVLVEYGTSPAISSAGASGAVFGVVGMILSILIKNRGKLENITLPHYALMVVLSVVNGFVTFGINGWAHLGGLITGLCFGLLLYGRQTTKMG